MSDYKMNGYELQSYFKSLCNSFYIAYEQVKWLEKEKDALTNNYNEEDLEMVKNLLKMGIPDSITNKYVTLKYSREELMKEKERLEADEREYKRKIKELEKILKFWSDNMWKDYEAIKSVLCTIKNNKFSIIVTTKAEIYALMCFYYRHSVEDYPVVNMKEEYRQAFPTGEELYDDFIYACEEKLTNIMSILYNKYF